MKGLLVIIIALLAAMPLDRAAEEQQKKQTKGKQQTVQRAGRTTAPASHVQATSGPRVDAYSKPVHSNTEVSVNYNRAQLNRMQTNRAQADRTQTNRTLLHRTQTKLGKQGKQF